MSRAILPSPTFHTAKIDEHLHRPRAWPIGSRGRGFVQSRYRAVGVDDATRHGLRMLAALLPPGLRVETQPDLLLFLTVTFLAMLDEQRPYLRLEKRAIVEGGCVDAGRGGEQKNAERATDETRMEHGERLCGGLIFPWQRGVRAREGIFTRSFHRDPSSFLSVFLSVFHPWLKIFPLIIRRPRAR